MKRSLLIIAISLLLFTVACEDKNVTYARDTIAVANGVLARAVDQYGDTCRMDAADAKCKLILKGISYEGLAIDALEAYCGFGPGSQPTDKCQPVKSLAPALGAALDNLNNVIADLRGVTQ